MRLSSSLVSLSPDVADSASPTIAASTSIWFSFSSAAVMIRLWTLATCSSSPELCTNRCQLYSVFPTCDLPYVVERVVQAHPHAWHFLGRILLPSFYKGFKEVPAIPLGDKQDVWLERDEEGQVVDIPIRSLRWLHDD